MDNTDLLELHSYDDCTNEDSEEKKKTRGLIYNKTNELIVNNYGYTDLYTYPVEMNTLFENVEDWDFHYSIESTLLRIYNYEGKWNISTNKKIDAYKSKWSCRQSFGELFEFTIQKLLHVNFSQFTSQLDENKVYYFILRTNQENRIVCHCYPRGDKMYYLGCNDKGCNPFTISTENINGILRKLPQPPLTFINNENDFNTTMENLNPFEYQGIIATNKITKKQIKILHPTYKEYYDIRGNNPNLRFRYLELRSEPEKLRLLYYLYPKYTDIFDSYEEILLRISRIIYQFYVSRYIKNQFITLPREEYLIVKKCHDFYLQNKKTNRIYSKKIQDIMNQEQPLHLYKMIRRYITNQKNNDIRKGP